MIGWVVTLADNRRFAWNETDGVHTERQARAAMAVADPKATIVSVEQEEVAAVIIVNLSEN